MLAFSVSVCYTVTWNGGSRRIVKTKRFYLDGKEFRIKSGFFRLPFVSMRIAGTRNTMRKSL